jgi:hypothetical protein
VRAVKEEGAFYYFEKPIIHKQLNVVLQRAIEQASTLQENVRLRRQLGDYGVYGKLVGNSHAMRQIYTTIEQVRQLRRLRFDHRRIGHGQRGRRTDDSSTQPAAPHVPSCRSTVRLSPNR